jgi:hypothetical protein
VSDTTRVRHCDMLPLRGVRASQTETLYAYARSTEDRGIKIKMVGF